jgi:hypothetical protein
MSQPSEKSLEKAKELVEKMMQWIGPAEDFNQEFANHIATALDAERDAAIKDTINALENAFSKLDDKSKESV